MARFIPLTAEQVTFELEIEVEQDVSPRGYFASGDDAQDASDETEILARLERGDDCAWCCLRVTAEDADGNVCSDSLGCVTLSDDHPCWGPRLTQYVRDQFPELWEQALADLNAQLQRKHAPRVMRTCTTKYLGPTDTRGSRVRARHNATRKVATVSWDHAQDSFENHADAAARVLGRRPEWSSSVDGGGYIFGVDPANDPADSAE